MSYDEYGHHRPRISPSSLILLVIFVGAAGLMVYLAIYQPGFGDDGSSATPTPGIVETAPPTEIVPPVEVPPDQAPGP